MTSVRMPLAVVDSFEESFEEEFVVFEQKHRPKIP